MKQLSLSIKEKYFNQIVEGDKSTETREIRPKNAERYCEFTEEGVLVGPKHYDTIKFITGPYQEKRPFVIVQVLNSEIILSEDENGELVTYEENGEEYIESEIVYQLGEIIDRSNY